MTGATMKGSVCVIDDDAEVRSSIGSLMRSSGYDARLYEGASQFLDAGLPAGASCLVLDIRLSGENGLEFQERLLELGISVPVILMTGHGDIPMTVRGMRAGAIDFLPKPFDDEQLIAAVEIAIARDKERRAQSAEADELQRKFSSLTPRERDVLGLVVTGLMNKQVAARLELSEITVKIHRGNVMRKMDAQSLADLVRMAELLGIRDATIRRYNT